MTAHYRNGPAEAAIQAEMLLAPTLRRQRITYYEHFSVWTALLALAIWSAHQAGNHFAFVTFLCAASYYITGHCSFDRARRKTIDTRTTGATEREISITADDDGLHEFIEGIQSSVPWDRVLNFRVYKEVLFVRLAADLHAIIPKDSFFSGDGSFEDFIKLLHDHEIEETEPPSPAPPATMF